MESLPYSEIEKGTFRIAMPDIDKGILFRSVILVCEHNSGGSFGLVVNKPMQLELPQELLNITTVANPKAVICAGGPMQTNQMMLLHSSSAISTLTLKICDGVFLGGDLQFLQEALSDSEGPFVHLCFGYAGWGAGQLEREFLDGNWLLWPANEDYLFHTPPEKLWSLILKDMGGKYAPLSMMPEDLSLN